MEDVSKTENASYEQQAPAQAGSNSKLSLYVMVFGWLALAVYLQLFGNFTDFSSFVKHFLAPDQEGIKYRALLFFTPLFFTVISYLIHEKEKFMLKVIEYQAELQNTNHSLEYRVRMQTDDLERTNRKLRKEIDKKKEINDFLALLEKAVMTTNTGITFCDMDYMIRFINKADAKMHGYKIKELLAKDVRILAPKRFSSQMDKITKEYTPNLARESVNIRKDGEEFPVALVSDIVKDEKGTPIGVITTCEDITDRMKSREELFKSLEEKSILLQEVHHRVRNNMQIIISLVQMHANHSNPQDSVEVYNDLQRRISSMALVHNTIYKSENFTNIRLNDFVSDMIQSAKRTLSGDAKNTVIEMDIDDSTLEINKLVSFGLLVNELFSYFFKLHLPESHWQRVKLKVRSSEKVISLYFNAEGANTDHLNNPEKHNQLSLTLIKSLSEQLNGKLEFKSDEQGQQVSLYFPY